MDILTQNSGFYYIAKTIFSHLETKSLKNCRVVCKSWCRFIDFEILNWTDILQKVLKPKKLQNWLQLHPEWNNKLEHLKKSGNIQDIKKISSILILFRKSNYSTSPYHQVVYTGDLTTLKFLLNFSPFKDNSLLSLAALKGYLSIVKFLISENFDANYVNPEGERPLHFAALNGDLAVFKVIWNEVIGEKNPGAENGATPFHFACQKGHRLIVKFIASKIKDTNPLMNDGTSVLHSAAESGHVKVIRFLFTICKDKSPRNSNGDTPLHFAVKYGLFETINLFHDNVEGNMQGTYVKYAYLN